MVRHCFSLRSLGTAAADSTKTQAASSPLPEEFNEKTEQDLLKRLRSTFDDETNDNGIVPAYKRALLYGSKIAVKDVRGEVSFSRLYTAAKRLAIKISNICGSGSSSRVCFLCPNDSLYVIAQWATWFSGQIAVPLSPRHPVELLEYYVKDCDANLLICAAELESILAPIAEKHNKPILFIDPSILPEIDSTGASILDPKAENVLQRNNGLVVDGAPDSKFYANSKALILYTSGTTGRPKGVVLTHKNLDAQITSIANAWHIGDKDTILHVLPLHHFHGVVNGLICPLNFGSKLIMLPQFESGAVWTHLLNVNLPMRERISLFMAVPTIYSMLIQEYDRIFASNAQMTEYIKSHCKNKVRLMISGSAPLPETVFNRWLEITGHKLLERYGMTECGMALSNPYIQDKNRERRPGTVGRPLPFVEVKITEAGNPKKTLIQRTGERGKGFWNKIDTPLFDEKPAADEPTEPISGDLYIRGPTVFSEYWQRPEETQKEFVDSWFKTGDTAGYENGYFRILGRSNVDIIKSGGYKLSALEIESKLLENSKIRDIAIVGLPDETWGSKVAALIVLKDGQTLTVEELKEWAAAKLPSYAFPTVVKFAEVVPKNAMGKVNKKELIKEVFTEKAQ